MACLLALVGCGDSSFSVSIESSRTAEDDESESPNSLNSTGPIDGDQTGPADGGGTPTDDDAPFVELPTPTSSAVPSFLTTGTRMTWYAAAASVAQSGFSITEDPTCASGGPGCYTDPQTGKFYRKSDEGPNAQGQPTASGDGYSQLDVMAIDGRNVALMSNLYVVDRSFNQLGWTPLGGATVDGVSLDGSWLPPADLERAVASGIGGVLVLTGEYQFGDRVVPSVSFVSDLGGSNYQSQTYDRQTGVLLSSNSRTSGATTPFTVEGRATPVTGNTQLTLTRLVSVRERSLPGQDGNVPDWVSGTSTLLYAGNYNWTNPLDSNSGNFDYPTEHLVTIGQRGSNWVSYVARTVVPGLAQDTTAAGVGGPVGLYWWDTQALQSMSEGQVIDEDPVTGERIVVSYHGPAATGGEIVVIESELPGVASRATYDMTGVLVAYEVWLGSVGATITIELVQRG